MGISNAKGSILTALGIICLLLIIGVTIIKPRIFTWGATEQETTMAMPGDNLAPFISSTRSITINAPISQVWQWLIQLGADRGGFYSYWFIENPLGYFFREQKLIEPEYKEMTVGRVVETSLDPARSLIKYSFTVVKVDPEKYVVLKNWGCFLLNGINPQQTRLIVRTHGRPLASWLDHLVYFLEMPLHYIMERRMLIGIKARAEAGPGMPFSSSADIMWFLGVCLSIVGIIGLLIASSQLAVRLCAMFYSVIWLWVIFILDPIPIYSVLLSVILIIHFGCIVTKKWLIRILRT